MLTECWTLLLSSAHARGLHRRRHGARKQGGRREATAHSVLDLLYHLVALAVGAQKMVDLRGKFPGTRKTDRVGKAAERVGEVRFARAQHEAAGAEAREDLGGESVDVRRIRHINRQDLPPVGRGQSWPVRQVRLRKTTPGFARDRPGLRIGEPAEIGQRAPARKRYPEPAFAVGNAPDFVKEKAPMER